MEHIQHVQVFILQSTHVLWRWELPASTTSVPKNFLPLGSRETLCSAFQRPSRRLFFLFFVRIRITYQCLCQKLAKTEHAINLLLVEVFICQHGIYFFRCYWQDSCKHSIWPPFRCPRHLQTDWGMPLCIMIVNSMPKLVVVVDNLSICNLFLALCSLYQPISHGNLANWF